jgi:hypothetical protein
MGRNALGAQNFTTATASNNTAVGYESGFSITTGIDNVLYGSNAGYALTDADDNVAIGRSALATDTLGKNQLLLVIIALCSQNFVSATDTYNTLQ